MKLPNEKAADVLDVTIEVMEELCHLTCDPVVALGHRDVLEAASRDWRAMSDIVRADPELAAAFDRMRLWLATNIGAAMDQIRELEGYDLEQGRRDSAIVNAALQAWRAKQ